MNILGLSCHYHDSAACLIQDGKITAAAQEERFNRIKYSAEFPIQSVNYCLQQGNITIHDIDHVCFYEKPFLKFSRVILSHLKAYPFSLANFLKTMPQWLQDRLIVPLLIKRETGYKGRTYFIKHHLSHAASAFLVSPFERAAILTADGVGEWATTTIGEGNANSVKILQELSFPDSLGLLYTAITTYLGFRALEGEGKVMGLAGYGKPRYIETFNRMISVKHDGSFRIDGRYFDFNNGRRMYTNSFIEIFGSPRNPEDKIEERHCDIAASTQKFVEDAVVNIANYLYTRINTDNICLAGGLFLNCVLNSRILESTPFRNIFVQPAAGDAGGALGAAVYTYNSLLNNKRNFIMTDSYLGPGYPPNSIKRLLINSGLDYREFNDDDLAKYIATAISENKIIGWFQGRMEFGPRALGNRSILANPCNPDIRDILNQRIKHREYFRPFAPVVMEEKADKYFDLKMPSPFMLLAPRVKPDKAKIIPSVTHIDGTARVQTVNKNTNPKLYRLLDEFEKITGVPVLLNTSFNLNGEPIVCNPQDAINSFKKSGMDLLVLESFVVNQIRPACP